MTKASLVLLLILPLVWGTGCGKKVDPNLKAGIEGQNDFEKLTGVWLNERRGIWMEFRADSTYDQGKGKEVKFANQNWKINDKKKELTLNTDRGWFKFTYRIEASGVFFKPEGKEKEAEFVKLKARP